MTWNICNPCETSDVDRAAEIATYAPQVIGLQEACARDVERIRDHLESLYGLVYHVEYGSVLRNWGRCGGVPWSPGAYGQAVLSAAPMTDRVNVEYPDGGSEDRGYMAVTTVVGGRSVRVFNTHLAERRQEAVRAEQIGVLAAEVARHDRAIVLGDFNAVPDAPELTPMWALAADVDPQCVPRPPTPATRPPIGGASSTTSSCEASPRSTTACNPPRTRTTTCCAPTWPEREAWFRLRVRMPMQRGREHGRRNVRQVRLGRHHGGIAESAGAAEASRRTWHRVMRFRGAHG
ncbi:endonuclease/exonuclease/phosphatase family protein [Streptomyces phaeoluteigriseus]|uniref:endonuclease/exonuclease/phosphatase family protein n=1 Tax=Streptomyces phaeoluteigriseus TaxID=114686 RepID=UPI003CCBB928